MWELPIHWDQDGRLILYNLAMIFFRLYFSSLRELMIADKGYVSYSNCLKSLLSSSIYFPIVISAKNGCIIRERPQWPHCI